MRLEDFKKADKNSLQQYKIYKEKKRKAVSEASNRNLSAHAAALMGEGAVDSFYQISGDLNEVGRSDALDQILSLANQEFIKSSREALVDTMSDPSVSLDEKEQAVQFQFNLQESLMDLRKTLGIHSLSEEGENEPKHSSDKRIETSHLIDQVFAHQNFMQKLYNREASKSSPEILDKVGDFAELMLPFAETPVFNDILRKLSNRDLSPSEKYQSLALLGSAKEDMANALRKMGLGERERVAEYLIDIVNQHSGILFTDQNDFARMEYIENVLFPGEYTDVDKWIDNTFSLLDTLGIISIAGAPLVGSVKGTLKEGVKKALGRGPRTVDGKAVDEVAGDIGVVGDEAEPIVAGDVPFGQTSDVPAFLKSQDELESVSSTRAVTSSVQPTSVSQTVKETNPDQSRKLHAAVSEDLTGEVAEASYMTNRTEAIVDDMVGGPANAAGSIKNKPYDPDRLVRPELKVDPLIDQIVNKTGDLHFTPREKRAARSRVELDFKAGFGLSARPNMFTTEALPNGLNVKAVYGPEDTGFDTAEEALESVKYAFREYGIKDDQITILKKVGDEYVPNDGQGGNNFLAAIDYNYKFNEGDVFEQLDVRNNWLDLFPSFSAQRHGSVQRHILDPASMLHPVLVKAASVGINKGVALEKSLSDLGNKFAKNFSKLNSDRQIVLEDFIRKANAEELELNTYNMKANGIFDKKEQDIIRSWKNVWDNLYLLENRDLVRSLKKRNFQAYVGGKGESVLYVKPTARNQIKSANNNRKTVDIYDDVTDSLVTLSEKEVADLYEQGGTLAELKIPVEIDGSTAKFIRVMNNEDSYLRALNDGDQVLNYRHGYYQINYKDPVFIEKIIRKNGEEEYRHAIATAGSIADAKHIVDRLRREGVEVEYRQGREVMSSESDEYLDMVIAQGRIAQRTRGEKLYGTLGNSMDPSQANILDPIDSLTRSIRSIARRTSMRDYLETSKARFMKQFDEVIPTKEGRKVPFDQLTLNDITNLNRTDLLRMKADARTTMEYIKYLESGYINSMDEFYKNTLRNISVMIGEKGFKRSEQALRAASDVTPTQVAKGTAFRLYLALNPIRQAIVQSHQSVRLIGLEPKYVGSGKIYEDSMILVQGLLGKGYNPTLLKRAGITAKEADEMVMAYKTSGIADAVDANNLVRGELTRLAEKGTIGKLKNAAGFPVRFSQKIGFDFGEQTNLTTAWLTFRHRAMRDGRKLDQEDWDNITAGARNFTYSMDAAGDMPYNQNVFNVVAQFLQVPHKAITNVTTNRQLTRAEKARMMTFDLALWGVPGATLLTTVAGIESPEARHVLERGFESWALNNAFQMIDGKSDVDFNSLAPYNVAGIYEFLNSLISTDLLTVIAESPSGSLIFKEEGKIQNLIRTTARYFNFIDDMPEQEFKDVVVRFLQLSSGMSNAFKAKLMLETGKKLSSDGQTPIVEDTTFIEAMAQIAGFNPYEETAYWETVIKSSDALKANREDLNQWYTNFKAQLPAAKDDAQAIENISKTMSMAWLVWGNDNPDAIRTIQQLILRDAQGGDFRMFQSILKAARVMTPTEAMELIRNAPIDEEERSIAEQILRDAEAWREEK